MPKILAGLEHLFDIGKSTEQEQTEMNVIEAGHLWNDLLSRYYVLEETEFLKNFAKDGDLIIILNAGEKVLNKQVKILEQWLKRYAIKFPDRPPYDLKTATKLDIVTDKYIFRRIFAGMQAFLNIHMQAFTQVPSPKLREQLKKFLSQEMELYDLMYEYGKFKSWVAEPPAYRV